MYLALRTTPAFDANWLDRFAHAVVKARLVTRYPHGGIVIGNTLFHSTSRKGVHATDDWTPDRWELYDVGGDDERALDCFRKRERNGYDWVGLLPFIGVPGSDSKRDYCFELCFYMMTGVRSNGLVTAETLLSIAMQEKRYEPARIDLVL